MFAIAAETGWPEERVLFMPLARLAQYQHCLLRRNGMRTTWSGIGDAQGSLRERLGTLRESWNGSYSVGREILDLPGQTGS